MSASSETQDAPYRLIVGLEVHVQLKTRSKLFCGCSTTFGAAPNSQTCPVCLGLPGALPVLNRHAVELALQTGLALNSTIPEFTKWDRKNYFYPDLPKGYQISQFDQPICQGGWLEIHDPKGRFENKRVNLVRAHLEEDAGKSLHGEATLQMSDEDQVLTVPASQIDLNRTGTPLLEIVSEPELHSPLEAHAYLDALKLLLTYLGVSDCNMQEGSLRVDANVNLHLPSHAADETPVATPIVEIKNLNSFRAVERALAYEAERQYAQFQSDGKRLGEAPKVTRGWDDERQQTFVQREKEESSDYRYFPDPDLVPLTIAARELDAVREAMPELPQAIYQRLQQDYQLTAYDADVLVNQGAAVVAYFESVAKGASDAKRASNWIQQEVLRSLNEREWTIDQFPIPASQLGELVQQVAGGQLDNSRAKDVFQKMLDESLTVAEAKDALGIVEVDESAIDDLCRELMAANPKAVEQIREGKLQAVGALIGQGRKQNPNVNPGQLKARLLGLIQES